MSEAGPLDGVSVVDFSQLIAGPSAAAMLGDLGARVIKVERVGGELGRSIGAQDGIAPTFACYNRGKRSLALDLSTEAGREVARRVIEQSDVVISAFRPGVAERMGLSYEQLRAQHPRLVYLSLSAFSPQTPRGQRVGVDAVMQAEAGIMSMNGEHDGEPCKVGFQVIDAAAGLVIAQAILAALLNLGRTGEGCEVKTSLFEVATFIQSPMFVQASWTHEALARPGNTAGHLGSPTDMFPARDGGRVMIAAYFPQQWIKLCTVLGVPELIDDERFADGPSRIRNQAGLRPLLCEVFLTKTAREWEAILADAGIIGAPVRTHAEIVSDPTIRALGSFVDVKPSWGEQYWLPRLPYASTSWPSHPKTEIPMAGEHSREILAQAGYSDEDIDRLIDGHVVGVDHSSRPDSALLDGGRRA